MNSLKLSALALGTSLMVGSIFSPIVVAKETAAPLSPQGGWSIAPISQGSAPTESYCALSRQYDQNLALTLGQNLAEEYSLAIDFQQAKLNVDKGYSITLQPGPGQIRAYEMMPASERAMVVRLGYDDSFMKALAKSNLLKAEVDGKNYEFAITDFDRGREDLKNCMAKLKGSNPAVMAKADTPAAPKGFSAEKVKDAPPMPDAVKPKTTMPSVPAPKVEAPKAPEQAIKVADAKPAQIKKPIEIVKAETKKIETPKAEIKKAEIKKAEVEKPQVAAMPTGEPINTVSKITQAEVAMPTRPIEIARVDTKQKPMAEVKKAETPKIEAPKTEMPKVETPKIESKKRVSEEIKTADTNTRKAKDDLLNKPLVSRQVDSNKDSFDAAPVPKMAMVEEPKKPIKEAVKEDPITVVEKIETQRLPEAIVEMPKEQAPKIEKPKVQQPKMETPKPVAIDEMSPKAEAELAAMNAKLKATEEENKRLYEEAKKARGQIDTAVVETSNQALKRMREYENKLEAAQSDNLALSKEIEELRRTQEDVSLQAVAGDWDLEKSTMRYNEAEREIKRLGLLLEQQRLAHRQERTELEGMLFDPAVTDSEQRKKLTELEMKLAAAEEKINSKPVIKKDIKPRDPIEERVSVMPAKPKTPIKSVALDIPKEANVYTAPPRVSAAPKAVSNNQSPEVQKLNAELKQKSQELMALKHQQEARQKTQPVENARVSRVSREPLERESYVSSSSSAPRAPLDTPSYNSAPRAAAPSASVSGFGSSNIQNVIQRAGLPLSGSVNKSSDGQYNWRAGKLNGKAKVLSVRQGGNIDRFAKNYIAQEKRHCSGDFASLPAPSSGSMKAYEIACVGGARSTSLSVIFTQKGDDLIAIAHEAPAEDMDVAIDARDRVASKL